MNLTPIKAAALAVIVAGALVLGVLLYPSFPRVTSNVEGPEAEASGRALLEEMLRAHGGTAAFEASRGLDLRIDDQWSPFFEAFSIWPGYSSRIQTLIAWTPTAYKARLSFPDSTLWGHDGSRTWVIEEGVGRYDSLNSTRAKYASSAVPRLLLLPVSIAHEHAQVRALSRAAPGENLDVLEVEFPSTTYTSRKDRWVLFVDAHSRHILRIVFESTASEPSYIENCFVEERQKVGELTLTRKLTCYMATKLAWDLHAINVEGARLLATVPDESFAPPGTGTATVARPRAQAAE